MCWDGSRRQSSDYLSIGRVVFTIKVCHMPDHEVMAKPELRDSLVAALQSMSPASRKYKGLDRDWVRLMAMFRG